MNLFDRTTSLFMATSNGEVLTLESLNKQDIFDHFLNSKNFLLSLISNPKSYFYAFCTENILKYEQPSFRTTVIDPMGSYCLVQSCVRTISEIRYSFQFV